MIETAEITDGALADGAGVGADGLHEGVVGVDSAVARLEQATEEHAGQCTTGRGGIKGRVKFSTLQGFQENARWQIRTYGEKQGFLASQLLNLG